MVMHEPVKSRLYGAGELSGVGTMICGLRLPPPASVAADGIVASLNAGPVMVARPGTLVFAQDGEFEDPVGTPVIKGRDTMAGLFASSMALASDVEINVLAAFPSGDCIAAHWTTTVRTKAGKEAKAEGIDVLEVNVQGLIVRAEGYWNAAAFREALA
jgi:ketosteroid isomerase-like protein